MDSGKPSTGPDVNLLSIVLDLAPDSWRTVVNGDPTLLTQCIDAVLALANAHVALGATNRILLTGCDQRHWLVLLKPFS